MNAARPPPLVMFIHDHTDVESLIKYLTDAGLRVARTRNGETMLTSVLSVGPDLIVLDFNIDGETASALKSDIRTKGIPLIALAEMATINTKSLGATS